MGECQPSPALPRTRTIEVAKSALRVSDSACDEKKLGVKRPLLPQLSAGIGNIPSGTCAKDSVHSEICTGFETIKNTWPC